MSDAKITLSAEDKTRAAFAGVKRNLLDLRDTGAAINQSFGGLGALLGSAFAGLSLTAFVRATADGLDRLNDLKDATGASIENISALEDVAARTGTTFDAVGTSLVKFNAVLADAKPGSEAANIFKSLGLSIEELKRQDPAEALRVTAVALAKFADDGDKARAVQQLFGKSVREVAPFLNDLAAAGQLNATVTSQQAEEAEKFNKQLAQLGKSSVDFARSLVGDVLPALNGFLEKITAINRSGGFFTSIAKELKAETVGDELKRVVGEIESIQATIDRQGGTPYLEKRLKGLRAEAAGLTKESADLSEWLKKFAQQADPFVDQTRRRQEDRGFMPTRASLAIPDAPKPGPKIKTPQLEINPIPDSLKDALRLIEQADSNKIAGLRLQLQELTDITASGLSSPGVYQAINGVVEQINKLDPAYQQAIADQQRLNELLAATPTAKLEKQREDMEFLAQAFEDGRLGLVGSQEAIEAYTQAVQAALGTAAVDAKASVAEIDEFSREAARNIQNALGSTLKSTLRGDFDSIGDLWGNLLLDMAAEAAAAQLGRVLLGDFSSSGAVGGLLGSGLDFLLGIGKADGGPVGARSIQRVNERGFEVFTDPMGQDWLMTGARGGMVTPSNQVAAASTGGAPGGNTYIDITNQVGGGMQRGEVYALMQTTAQQIKADMLRYLKDQRVLPS